MILQSLVDFYGRKATHSDDPLPPPGLTYKEIPWIIKLTPDGKAVDIQDTRILHDKVLIGTRYLVPKGVKKTSGIAANLLWDSAEYVLCLNRKNKPERTQQQHSAFIERILALPAAVQQNAGVRAVLVFLKCPQRFAIDFPATYYEWMETNPFITFGLVNEELPIPAQPFIHAVAQHDWQTFKPDGICMVRGELDAIEHTHSAIKGVWGAQVTGANIVSFNLDAFNSYGKSQGTNAPVGKQATFAYTTALNHLLDRNSRQRIQIGDASTIFWGQTDCTLEHLFTSLLTDPDRNQPEQSIQALADHYECLKDGVYHGKDGDTLFHVLGLSPNAARLSIRFFHSARVKDIAANIARHHHDLKIDRPYYEKSPYPSLYRLLLALTPQNKAENIPSNLAGDMVRSILTGNPYPATLLQALIRRIRAEQDVGYLRAALLKAVINRQYSHYMVYQKELTMSLDLTNLNPGYRLGRLFATLERVQERAIPGSNTTIRNRSYGAASSTPVNVFPSLLKLKNQHISKLENRGEIINFESLLSEIVDGISDFPSHLSLKDQGYFAVGYYHQRQDFYKSKLSTTP